MAYDSGQTLDLSCKISPDAGASNLKFKIESTTCPDELLSLDEASRLPALDDRRCRGLFRRIVTLLIGREPIRKLRE